MKNNMKETDYYKSGKHLTNVLAAREKANNQSRANKQKRIDEYNLSPNRCKHCDTAMVYQRKTNKFCGSSCAATHNNSNRAPRSSESRKKTSIAMKGKSKPYTSRKRISGWHCKIMWSTCPVCNILFYSKGWTNPKKSCGKSECRVHLSVGNRTYTNGRRKLFYYFNKHQDKTVLLESTWEYNLAVWLDEQNIEWIRPSYIKWTDASDKERLYYPDFYLPALNLYLDPKNPTAMKKDAFKMAQVSKLVDILYGNVIPIQQSIISRVEKSNFRPMVPNHEFYH